MRRLWSATGTIGPCTSGPVARRRVVVEGMRGEPYRREVPASSPSTTGRAVDSSVRGLRALLRWTPQTGTGPAAVRAGVTVAVPLVLLAAAGRVDLALYATFGAFTAVYGRRPDGSADVRVQARHAVVMVAAVATGCAVALSDHRALLAVPVAAAWAAGAAALSERQHWRPPGPLFPVFAVGACSAVARADPGQAAASVGVGVGAAVLALVVSAVSGVVPVRRAAPARPTTAHAAPAPASRQRVQALRCGVAVLVAGALATAAPGQHPYWAMVAAVVPMAAATLGGQLLRAAHRVVGTLGGLVLAGALLALPLGTWAVVAVAVALQVAAELLVTRHYGAAMLAITPLALLVGQLAHPVPVGALLADRGLETLLGVLVGAAVVVLTRQRRGRLPVSDPR